MTTTERFMRWVDRSFAEAIENGGVADHWVEVAGRPVLLRLVGETPELLRPLRHISCAPADEASLTICAWDTKSTGIPPAWTLTDHDRRRFDEDAGVDLGVAPYRRDVGAWTLAHALYDASRRRAWYCLPTVGSLRHQRASPFHIPLAWWAEDEGLQVVHAGAVGGADGAVLLTGAGGAGKSTTALASVCAGLGYAGDDYCLATVGPDPVVHTLFATGKVAPEEAWRVPALGEVAAPDGEDKALIYVNELFPERIRASMPVRAILLPRVEPGRTKTELTPIKAQEALLALAPSTIFQVPLLGARALANMAQLVRSRPAFRLSLGPDTAEVAGAIRAFLERG